MASKFMSVLKELKEKFENGDLLEDNYQENLVNTILEDDSSQEFDSIEKKIFINTKRYLDLSKPASVVIKRKDIDDKDNGIVIVFRERFRSFSGLTFSDGIEELRRQNGCAVALAIGFQSNPDLARLDSTSDKIISCHFTKVPDNGFKLALDKAFPDFREDTSTKSTEIELAVDSSAGKILENTNVQNYHESNVEESKNIHNKILSIIDDKMLSNLADQMLSSPDEQIISSLKTRIETKKFALYLGAGTSRPFDFPNWYQMIKETIEVLSTEHGSTKKNSNFIGDLSSSLQSSYSTIMFSSFVSHFCSKVTEQKKADDAKWDDDKSLKIGIDGVVKKYLDKTDRFIGSLRDDELPINIISEYCGRNKSIPLFTTNYDPVAELSMLYRGGKPQTTWNYAQRKDGNPDSEICHLHGISIPIDDKFLADIFDDRHLELNNAKEWLYDVKEEEKRIQSVPVLLENSYTLIREKPYCFALYPLLQAFTDRSILIIGSSLTDVNLRLIAKKAFDITGNKQFALMRIGPSLQEIATHNEIEKSEVLKSMRDAPFTEIGLTPIWKTDSEISSFLNRLFAD